MEIPQGKPKDSAQVGPFSSLAVESGTRLHGHAISVYTVSDLINAPLKIITDLGWRIKCN